MKRILNSSSKRLNHLTKASLAMTAFKEDETTSGDRIRVMEEGEVSQEEGVMEREEGEEEGSMIEDEVMVGGEASMIDSPAVPRAMVNTTERIVGEEEREAAGVRTEAQSPSSVQDCHPPAQVLI